MFVMESQDKFGLIRDKFLIRPFYLVFGNTIENYEKCILDFECNKEAYIFMFFFSDQLFG